MDTIFEKERSMRTEAKFAYLQHLRITGWLVLSTSDELRFKNSAPRLFSQILHFDVPSHLTKIKESHTTQQLPQKQPKMSTTFKLENASSGRSKCKKCKGQIGKGELRIQKIFDTADGRHMSQNYLVGCVPIPRVYKDDVQAFMCDLEDSTDDMMLSNEEGTRQIYDTIMEGRAKAAAKKKSGKKAASDDDGAGPVKKAQAMPEKLLRAKFALELRMKEEEEGEEEETRPKKRAKRSSSKKEIGDSSNGLSPQVLTDLDRAYADMLVLYQDKNLDGLKDYLRWNQQVLKGTKPLLLMKCMDGHLNGRLARCPLCHEGKLNLEMDDTVQCSGYFDEDTHQRVACNYSSKAADAPRSKWYIEKPSEEEEEEMKKEASNPDTVASNSVAEQMVDALASFQFRLKTKAEIKSATGVFLDMARRFNLNVSEDDKEAKRSIGPLILSNRTMDLSSLEFCSIVCDHFGVKKSGEQVEEQRKVVRSMCQCADNATLYEIIIELGHYYRKESNIHAANTYSKVAATIRRLPFEITEENVMGLSKGVNKVPGIGKSSAEKMKEFLSTGSMQKLEEKRAAHAK